MANYSKSTNFATKDSLLTGDPLKVIKGTEIDDEFESLETAISTKADTASPTFTGTPKAPTAASGTNTTQIATTAYVQTELASYTPPNDSITSAMIVDNTVSASDLNVSGNGTSGQLLQSDGDGSFSWYSLPGAASNPFIEPAETDPTERDDASALQEGDIYYNTADNKLKSYDGTDWQGVGTGIGEGPIMELGSEMPSYTQTAIASGNTTAEYIYEVVDTAYYKITTSSGAQQFSAGSATIELLDSSDVRLNPRAGLWSSLEVIETGSSGISNGEDVFFGGGVLCFLSYLKTDGHYFNGSSHPCYTNAFVWLNAGEKIKLAASSGTNRVYNITKYEFS